MPGLALDTKYTNPDHKETITLSQELHHLLHNHKDGDAPRTASWFSTLSQQFLQKPWKVKLGHYLETLTNLPTESLHKDVIS